MAGEVRGGEDPPVVFAKMIRDFKFMCPSKGRGQKRSTYKVSRSDDVFQQAAVKQTGDLGVMMDWFEFEEHFQKKKLDQDEIERKWRKAMQDRDNCDFKGENPMFPERACVVTQSFVKTFDEKRRGTQAIRSTGENKGKCSDEDFDKLIAEAQDCAS